MLTISFDFIKVAEYILFRDYLTYKCKELGLKNVESTIGHIVSMLSCWKFIYYSDYNSLIAYYWYDLAYCLVHYKYDLIYHHLLTMSCLFMSVDNPDYQIIHRAIYLGKVADATIYIYKIIEACKLYEDYPLYARMCQLLSLASSIFLWSVFRCVLMYRLSMQAVTFEAKLIHVLFQFMHVIYIYKMYNKFMYIVNDDEIIEYISNMAFVTNQLIKQPSQVDPSEK
jgi:hypothetical protein